jgi:hypothetical protein
MSAWSSDDWDAFCSLLEHGFPGDFPPEASKAYRLLLDGTDPGEIVAALRRLLHRGHTFRPSAAELLGEVRADPSRPTFEEAFTLIYGPRGAFRARVSGRWADEGERRAMIAAATRERLAGMHPLIGAFVDRLGMDYLRGLELEDPDYSQLRRKELRDAWERHVDAFGDREVAALAAGTPRGELGMHKFDPLAALGVPAGARELESGSSGRSSS